ncbi:hypothetical protein K2173_028580 [Erythroxylum novogranatense]|uniref:Cation/H+ exchanger transmembrane domain-containing protein n=1 Tax=Erythroxylum novogranatense TaxID=1862640 RepID=A0AAV8U6D4_9ROSI|nr:hypothetical protein K2173_028580 [Erythroxylum novogranatense]
MASAVIVKTISARIQLLLGQCFYHIKPKVKIPCSTTRFGVTFLLSALGLEFSTTKLCGGKPSEGVFVGAFLSMSSITMVLKFFMERNSINSLHGQVTIGTLILQVFIVDT